MTRLTHKRSSKALHWLLAVAIPMSSGCQTGVSRYFFLGKPKPAQEAYRDNATEVDHSDVAQPPPPEIETTAPPRTVSRQERDEIKDMGLQEAIHTALANSDVIRSAGQFLSPGNTLLANPANVASIYDPAIQDSGVLFGGIGTEAALADFDATLSSSLTYGRDETVANNPFFGGAPGGVLEQNNGSWATSLTKQTAYGAQLSVSHQVDYSQSNAQGLLFPSAYTGNVQGEYRQQLLAGSGADFVRVAGPLATGFTSIAGVSNGVAIARINNDISITQFEANVRNLVKDVEDTYWDLYLAYRNFDTAVTARNTALDTWRVAKAKREIGGVRGFTNSEEAQARDRYFETRAQAENALGELYVTEQRLRELLGLPVNDRSVIRPADDPIAAKLESDWYHALALGLTERVELRRQKWNIKSLELQLGAARNFARPRLDLVAQYRVNGFGDQVLANSDRDKFGGDLNSFYHKLAEGDETGYNFGLEFNMPFGLRQAKTQVRNIELRLTKARKVLAAQELEIGHELAVAFQQLETAYATAVSNYSRRSAALERVKMIGQELEVGSGANTLDRYLRAQESLAAAENAYHQSLVDYNKAIVNFYYRQGTLLQEDSIHLVEGKWHPEAYKQAYARAKSRAHALPARHLRTTPEAFAADGHLNEVGFAAPEARKEESGTTEGMKLEPYPEELPLPIPADEQPETTAGDVPQAPGETAPREKGKYFEEENAPELKGPMPKQDLEVEAQPRGQFPSPTPRTASSQREALMPGQGGIERADFQIDKSPAPFSPIENTGGTQEAEPASAKPGKATLNLSPDTSPPEPPENSKAQFERGTFQQTGQWETAPEQAEVEEPVPSTKRIVNDLGKAIPNYK